MKAGDRTPVDEGVGARGVVSGGMWTLAASLVTVVASLIATPFVLRGLGAEAYGVFSVVQVAVGYFAVADFGMGDASTRFASDAYARGDRQGEVEAVWTSVLLQVVPSAVAIIALTGGAWYIASDVLRLPSHIQAAAVAALPIAGVAMIVKNLATIFNSPQVVRLRFRELALINTTCGVVQIATIPMVVWRGGSLAACVAVIAAANLLGLICHAVYALRLLPELRSPRVRRALARRMIRYGAWMVVVTLVITLLMQSEKILISRFASPTALAHYTVAFSLASLLTILPRAIKGVLFPIFSRLQAEPSQTTLTEFYSRTVRVALISLGPLVVLMCIVAAPFISVWAGAEYGRHSAGPFYVLTIGFLASGATAIPVVLLKGLARVDLLGRFNLIQVGPYVVVAALLTWSHGAVGGAIAFALRALVDAAMHFGAVRRVLQVRIWPDRGQFAWFLTASLVVAAPLATLSFSGLGLFWRLALTAPALGLYVTISWRRVFSPAEKEALRSLRMRLTGRDASLAENR